ncbi:hypothetical protein FRC01_013659 [Tulasnella sp. 417]|nr:hypothetical protein FRC01_013659 [Tulasnella sp. 417]
MAPTRSPITCHILDAALGRPAANVAVRLEQLQEGTSAFSPLANGTPPSSLEPIQDPAEGDYKNRVELLSEQSNFSGTGSIKMSTSQADLPSSLPIVDLDIFRSEPGSAQAQEECKKAADALITYGALVVKDSRVSESDNETFLDLMEDYFAQSDDLLKKDERPEFSYQVGVTL